MDIMLSIRDSKTRNTKYGMVTEVTVAGPKAELQRLLEMYDKPMSRDLWGIDREQYAWNYDGSLQLGFAGNESDARHAVQDAFRILGGGARANPSRPRRNPDDVQGLNWACSECNYQGTGEAPERCPHCGKR